MGSLANATRPLAPAGDNPRAEGVDRAFDSRLTTKWLDFGGGGSSGCSWLEYRLLAQQPDAVVTHYDIVSADDCPERDPFSWVLEGAPAPQAPQAASESAPQASSAKVEAQWVPLHRCDGTTFSERRQLKTFALSPGAPPCRAFRLRVTRTRQPAAANSVQLSCWNLYAMPQSAVAGIAAQGAAGPAAATPPAAKPAPAAGSRLKQSQAASISVDASMLAGWEAAAAGSVPDAHQQLLDRILGNLHRHPQDARFRKIRWVIFRLCQPACLSRY